MSIALANAGKEAIEKKTKLHRDKIRERGYGTHYGDHSTYKPPPGASLTKSSCVVWAMECAEYAFDKVGMSAQWDAIAKITRRNQLKGTILIGELIKKNWTGIYWNPDTTDKADDGEHSYSNYIAKTKKTYYGVRVQDRIVDYRRSTPDLTGIAKLKKVPFWIGCAGGGRHVFCGTGGNVSEFHWDYPATDPNAMELKELQHYVWMSGIIAVPPTVWKTASS